jgi:hypothetical protein
MPFRIGPRFSALIRLLIVGASLMTGALLLTASAAQATIANDAKEECVYTAHKISILDQFEQMVGENINCVQVYIAADTWQHWDSPWFINYYVPNSDWSQWATAPGTNRQLIITQSLAPSEITSQSDWLELGAAGAYTQYARAFAQNLVAAGLGGSVLRLGSEANGTWNADSLGSTPAQWALWDQFWRETVTAMRSVPGAHFQCDFNIAALYRPLPLSEIYPGNAYVDFIGLDAYDSGNIGNTDASRWNYNYTGPDGIQTVADFAKAHGKPLSIPEWGVGEDVGLEGFGDDPTFVNGIASVVRDDDTAYQCYFYNYGNATELATGPLSLAAYRAHFGPRGDSLGPDAGSTTPMAQQASAASPDAQASKATGVSSNGSGTRGKTAKKRGAKKTSGTAKHKVKPAKHKVKRVKHEKARTRKTRHAKGVSHHSVPARKTRAGR